MPTKSKIFGRPRVISEKVTDDQWQATAEEAIACRTRNRVKEVKLVHLDRKRIYL